MAWSFTKPIVIISARFLSIGKSSVNIGLLSTRLAFRSRRTQHLAARGFGPKRLRSFSACCRNRAQAFGSTDNGVI